MEILSIEQDIYPFLRHRVEEILEAPFVELQRTTTGHIVPADREWTVQGFGMMRTYLDGKKTWRLNVYHPELMVPGVSVHHNHPWDFTSWIVGGELTNTRYTVAKTAPAFKMGEYRHMHVARIMTGIASNVGGPGEGGVAPQFDAWLRVAEIQRMSAGATYGMAADEVHMTEYTPGCVTINRRIVREGTGEHADVFWPYGTDWISAKPRIADGREVLKYTSLALKAINSL